jgi:hypothetical protein
MSQSLPTLLDKVSTSTWLALALMITAVAPSRSSAREQPEFWSLDTPTQLTARVPFPYAICGANYNLLLKIVTTAGGLLASRASR